MDLVKTDYREQLLESIKKLETEGLSDEIEIISKVVEEQKVYFWIRLYLKEEDLNIQVGDDIVIRYQPRSTFVDGVKIWESEEVEELVTKFICYGKKGLEKDHDNEVVNYSNEDDSKILCLMVDETTVNFGEGIGFIRTLFKTGRHYEYQLVRRDELLFINKRNGVILDYFDCDF
jgi:hypothetical protein